MTPGSPTRRTASRRSPPGGQYFGGGDRFTRVADALVRLAGVGIWTIAGVWLFGRKHEPDDDKTDGS